MECKYGKYYLANNGYYMLIPEAFTRVDVDKDLNTCVNVYNIDEVAPELMR